MHLYRAGQHPEAFLEVVTVRRRPATRRNEHVEDREAAARLLAREQHGVGVADNREVEERLVVGTRDRELARRIISCQGRRGSNCRVVHLFLPVANRTISRRDERSGLPARHPPRSGQTAASATHSAARARVCSATRALMTESQRAWSWRASPGTRSASAAAVSAVFTGLLTRL